MAAFAWCALPRIEKLRYKVHLQIKERSRLIEIERTEKSFFLCWPSFGGHLF